MSAAAAKPRVLYVITDLLTGGAPLNLFRLSVRMASRGFDPLVFCLAGPGPVSELLAQRGVEVIHGFARSTADVRVILRLAALIRRQRPDLVHSFLFHANLAARFARVVSRYPCSRLVNEIHTVEIDRRWHLWLDGFTQDLALLEVGISPSVVSHLSDRAHLRRDRLLLIRGGIDVTAVDAAPTCPRSHWGLPDEIPLGLWVGRLDPVKGLDHLLEGVSQVVKRQPFQLAIVGTGEQEHHLRNLRDRLQLSGCVSFLGRRDDVASLLKTADLFVFPSHTEGLPTALLEAMAAALPIVTTDVPGCRDLIADGRTGRLVPPGKPHALAQAMSELLLDRALGRRLGAEARREVVAHWSAETTFQEYERLYLRVLNGP